MAEIREGEDPEDPGDPGKEWSADEFLARAEALAKAEAEAARQRASRETEPLGPARVNGENADPSGPAVPDKIPKN